MKKTIPLNIPTLKFTIALALVLVLALSGKGQDVNFTQYQYAPYSINPAQPGSQPARIMLNHRTRQMAGNLQFQSTRMSMVYPLIHKDSKNHWADVGGKLVYDTNTRAVLWDLPIAGNWMNSIKSVLVRRPAITSNRSAWIITKPAASM